MTVSWGTDPCANCGHLKMDHRHVVLPWFSREPRDRECEVAGCLCELFVRDAGPGEADKPARAA